MLERENCYLLKSQLNPFSIRGTLRLDDDARLRFILDPGAAGSALGWLEKRLGKPDLKARLKAGERPLAFDLPVAGRTFKWPKRLGGYGMKFDGDDGDGWIVTLNNPNDLGVFEMISILSSKSDSKPWKDALAAAGAN